MTNGKKDLPRALPKVKRLSDLIPEGKVVKPENDLSLILDKDVLVTSIVESRDPMGGVRHVTIAYEMGDEQGVLNISKKRVMEKLVKGKKELPFVIKIKQDGRYYDIV